MPLRNLVSISGCESKKMNSQVIMESTVLGFCSASMQELPYRMK